MSTRENIRLIARTPYRWPFNVCLFCCFTSQVNSYGHGRTVSSPNHTFSLVSLNKQLTSTFELATPGSAVRLASVARHDTDCSTWPHRWPFKGYG